MKAIPVAALMLALSVAPGWAELVEKTSVGTVAETMDRLEAAVEGAGATVFARVDHAAGAAAVEMPLAQAQLLIFGNPRLGTPVMQQDIRAGLVLPLHVLVYDDAGTTKIVYDSVPGMMEGLTVDLSAEVFGRIAGALDNLTNTAMSGG